MSISTLGRVVAFEFVHEHDGTLPLETAVFQALGAASTCWERMDKTGVFDSTAAKEIGDALVARIRASYRVREGQ